MRRTGLMNPGTFRMRKLKSWHSAEEFSSFACLLLCLSAISRSVINKTALLYLLYCITSTVDDCISLKVPSCYFILRYAMYYLPAMVYFVSAIYMQSRSSTETSNLTVSFLFHFWVMFSVLQMSGCWSFFMLNADMGCMSRKLHTPCGVCSVLHLS